MHIDDLKELHEGMKLALAEQQLAIEGLSKSKKVKSAKRVLIDVACKLSYMEEVLADYVDDASISNVEQQNTPH